MKVMDLWFICIEGHIYFWSLFFTGKKDFDFCFVFPQELPDILFPL